MQDMIDALLDYSRVRTDAAAFTETNAEEVYSETLADLGLLIDEHDVTVSADDLPTVEVDRNQLGQLLQNLIENAIQHGGSEIHIGATQHEDEVVFSVSDDGPGIRDSQQERIFEIFEQGSRDDEGTGIGLAICDRIVSRHDGEMWVESAEGEGTTFYFSIPA
jgi:signal transduction histidine kinase